MSLILEIKRLSGGKVVVEGGSTKFNVKHREIDIDNRQSIIDKWPLSDFLRRPYALPFSWASQYPWDLDGYLICVNKGLRTSHKLWMQLHFHRIFVQFSHQFILGQNVLAESSKLVSFVASPVAFGQQVSFWCDNDGMFVKVGCAAGAGLKMRHIKMNHGGWRKWCRGGML